MHKRVLLTGGLGFIGSHTVEHYLATTDWDIVVIDSLRYAGRVERLTTMKRYDPDRVTLVWHDLRSPLHNMIKDEIGDIDYIVNMASDSHVERSISDPVPFIKNNITLVLNMLEYAREIVPEKFVQVSTDEVFGPAPAGYSHVENDLLHPSNPYSASKASQEMIAFSYWRTFNVPVIITNTMNNFGERQDIEKFIPMTISKIQRGEKNIIHACKFNGQWVSGSRVWLHARNHADAVKFILETITPVKYGDSVDTLTRFNIAGDREISNVDIVNTIASIMQKEANLEFVDFHSSRPGHDLRYSLDGTRIREAGWSMPISTEESFERMVKWSLENPKWLKY